MKNRPDKVTKVKDLVKTTRGFFQMATTKANAAAMFRGQKTNFLCSASHNVQKGDYLVLSVDDDQFHDIAEVVWAVTFVANLAHAEQSNGYGTVSLSLSRLEGWRFEKGDIGGQYLDDCIVKED